MAPRLHDCFQIFRDVFMYGYQTARCVMLRSISTLQSLVFSVYLYIHLDFCSVGFFRKAFFGQMHVCTHLPSVLQCLVFRCFSMFFVVFYLFYVLNYFLFFSLRDVSVCARYYFCRACFVSNPRVQCSLFSRFGSFRSFVQRASAQSSFLLF